MIGNAREINPLIINQLKLDFFFFVKKLGFGQFGNVYLIHNKNDAKCYALKCITKSQILKNKLEKHLKVLFSASKRRKCSRRSTSPSS